MKKVIMVSGLKGSGKDFVSKILADNIEGLKVQALATPIKDIIATTLDIDLADLEEFKNREDGLYIKVEGEFHLITNFRKVVQKFGTEAMQKWFGKNVWVLRLLDNNIDNENTLIVSDFRLIEEFVTLNRFFDVITIRVNDDNLVSDGHISESEINDFDFDFVIDNTNKDESIYLKLFEIIEVIKNGKK